MIARSERRAHMNIPMCIAAVLFCLTLFSLHLMSGLYAKYVVSDDSGDSARVIKFGDLTLTETGDFVEKTDTEGNKFNQFLIVPGVDLEKKATLEFEGSESAVYVFMKVEPSASWSTTDNKTWVVRSGEKELMKCTIADGWKPVPTTDGTYVYYQLLEPNTQFKKEAFAVPEEDPEQKNTIWVSEEITRTEIAGLKDLQIELQGAVVQAGGFKDVEEAWASIAAK